MYAFNEHLVLGATIYPSLFGTYPSFPIYFSFIGLCIGQGDCSDDPGLGSSPTRTTTTIIY
jgi:hypothetical protein